MEPHPSPPQTGEPRPLRPWAPAASRPADEAWPAEPAQVLERALAILDEEVKAWGGPAAPAAARRGPR